VETGISGPGATVDLKSQPWLWRSMAWLGFAFAALMLLVAVAAGGADGPAAARLGFAAVSVFLAAWGFVFGRRAQRLSRARPRLVLLSETLLVEHPGLLREPITIARADVEAVCLGSFVGYRQIPPKGTGVSPWKWLRRYSRWLDSGGPTVTVSASRTLPDISNVVGGRTPDILVVLRRPFDLSTLPRRGLDILVPETAPFSGPVRGARIRGFLATATELDSARQAFSPWGVVRETPTEEMLAWVAPPRSNQRHR
jgi:hypothetical protein